MLQQQQKNRDGFAYKSSKAARRLIHPLRAPSHTDKQLPLLVIPQRLQSRLGWSGVEKMENILPVSPHFCLSWSPPKAKSTLVFPFTISSQNAVFYGNTEVLHYKLLKGMTLKNWESSSPRNPGLGYRWRSYLEGFRWRMNLVIWECILRT